MPKGDTVKRLERHRRLEALARLFKERDPSIPITVTQLAIANKVSTPTIYRDLEILRAKLGVWIVGRIPLGGGKHG